MGCYICDNQQEEVRLDHRDMKIAPCGTCEEVIQDCLDTYPKTKKELEESQDYVAYMETSLEDLPEFKTVHTN